MYPSLSDGGTGSQRDLSLDHLVHETPEHYCGDDDVLMVKIIVSVILRRMVSTMMINLKSRTTRMPPTIKETPNKADKPGGNFYLRSFDGNFNLRSYDGNDH